MRPNNRVETLTLGRSTVVTFFSCEDKLSPVTLTFKLDLDIVKLNHRARYLGQS